MTEKPLRTSPDKHRESIIQGAATRRVRRPGSKRQLQIVIYVIVVIVAAIVAAYLLLRPRDESYALREYHSEIVQMQTILDDLELGGTTRVRTEATVKASTTGVLESLAVDVGDWVVEGELVAVLSAEELQASYETQQQNLVQTTRSHQTLLLNWEQTKLSTAQARRQLVSSLEASQDSLADARQFYQAGTITAAALAAAEDAVDEAAISLQDHDAGAAIASQLHELQRAGSEDTLISIENAIADLAERLADMQVTSPIEGRVIWTVDTITSIGEPIAETTPILQIADTRDPFVETSIEEQYVSQIVEGQSVVVTVSGNDYPGTIERIGLLAQAPAGGGVPAVEMDLTVEAVDIEVLPGSTALVRLIVDEIPDALVLPRGPFLVTGNSTYVYVIDGESAKRTVVTYGAVTEQHVQITTGVSAGDEVITSSYQNYIDYQVIDLEGNND